MSVAERRIMGMPGGDGGRNTHSNRYVPQLTRFHKSMLNLKFTSMRDHLKVTKYISNSPAATHVRSRQPSAGRYLESCMIMFHLVGINPSPHVLGIPS